MQNHAYTRQLVQELVKCYFQLSSVGNMLLETCFLLFMNQCLTNSVYSLPQANLFQFGIIVCQFILVCTKNSKAYVFMQAFSPIAYRFLSTECPWFSLFFTTHHIIVLRNVFHVRDKKCLMLPCIKLCVTGNLLRGGCRTLRT